MADDEAREAARERSEEAQAKAETAGRWPANVINDGSKEVLVGFPDVGISSGGLTPGVGAKEGARVWRFGSEISATAGGFGDSGSAARFFYCAKSSPEDRDAGCEGMKGAKAGFAEGTGLSKNGDGTKRNSALKFRNDHPTVKPTSLMRYLCRLVTPPGVVVLDPFMGSGSTGKAAVLEGFRFRFIGIDIDEHYVEIARARIEHASRQGLLNFEEAEG